MRARLTLPILWLLGTGIWQLPTPCRPAALSGRSRHPAAWGQAAYMRAQLTLPILWLLGTGIWQLPPRPWQKPEHHHHRPDPEPHGGERSQLRQARQSSPTERQKRARRRDR